MKSSDFLKRIGQNIKRELKHSGMSQRELAEESFISESLLCMYIKGTRQPSIINLTNIAVALNCTVRDLIGEEHFID